jgi:oligopeptide/dipeptide ABC transporter ATP-binding protein
LRVENLRTYFYTAAGIVKSVDGVSFTVDRGETVAIVGESGSGKSVTSLSIMRLLADPGKIVAGRIEFTGNNGQMQDLVSLSQSAMRKLRGNALAMIFQEPMTSLNPVFTAGEQIAEAIMLHQHKTRRAALQDAARALETVGIADPVRRLKDYPHQLSGGMRQRVMIAMALSCQPSLLIADEPTTALDVTIQAQILDLMRNLQRQFGMSMLFITHNLGVVAEIADRVVVMYSGRVVESASVHELFSAPKHPYTIALLKSVPQKDQIGSRQTARLDAIPGAMPNPLCLPPACVFQPRCKFAVAPCSEIAPELEQVSSGHLSRCLRAREL